MEAQDSALVLSKILILCITSIPVSHTLYHNIYSIVVSTFCGSASFKKIDHTHILA